MQGSRDDSGIVKGPGDSSTSIINMAFHPVNDAAPSIQPPTYIQLPGTEMKDPLRDPKGWGAFREWAEWCTGRFLTPLTRLEACGNTTLSLTEPPGRDTCQAWRCDNKKEEAEGVGSSWQSSVVPSEKGQK